MATTPEDPKRPIVMAGPSPEEPDSESRSDDRRSYDRYEVEWAVDCIADGRMLRVYGCCHARPVVPDCTSHFWTMRAAVRIDAQ